MRIHHARVTAVTDSIVMRCYSFDLAGRIDTREARCYGLDIVIRKLSILLFVLSVAGNSLAAALPYIIGDGDCEASCCRSARHNETRASFSRLCCVTQCAQRAEAPGVPESISFSTGRDARDCGSPAAGPEISCSVQTSAFLHSPSSYTLHSNHIYLKTGALLI